MVATSRRVVITGLGVVSPLGNSSHGVWEKLSRGESGIDFMRSVPTDALPTRIAGEAREFSGDIDGFGDLDKDLKRSIRKQLKVMCREIAMGVAAAQAAMKSAGLAPGGFEPDRMGTSFGSDYIMTLPEEFADGIRKCLDARRHFHFEQWAEDGMAEVNPLWLLKYLPNMPASHIAIFNDLRGPSNSITLREASGHMALAEAFCILQRGAADAMLAGATGTRVHPLRSVHIALQEEVANGEWPPAQASRPFDLRRGGMVLGEGAGALVLETLSSAQGRGAPILGEFLGYGSSTVATPRGVADRRSALRNAIRRALISANRQPLEIGHIHAHGLSTRAGDAEEAGALQDVFGDQLPPVTAAKSYFGHLGAGSGVVESAASLLALAHNRLFALLNYEDADPACPIRPARGGDSPGSSFLSLSVTPQGQASAVVIGRFAD